MKKSAIVRLRKYFDFSLIILFLFLSTQCASTKMGDRVNNDYKMDLGVSEKQGVEKVVQRLTNRHHFELERDDTYRSDERFVRTYWRTFPPFSSNLDYEAKQVKVRVILQTREKNSQGYKLYNIKFIGEYLAELPDQNGTFEFRQAPLTPEAEKYLKDIANDLKDEVRGSIRGF